MKNIHKFTTLFPFYFLLFILFSFLSPFPVHAEERQNVDLSATIVPTKTDFQFEIVAADGKSMVDQNETRSYKITYGSYAHGIPTNMTLVADWSSDMASNGTHVMDYVVGSASNAYGNTAPVVDLTERTITWNINSFPGGTTDQSVTFQLKANTNYSEYKPVQITIVAKMSNQYVTMPNQGVQQTYLVRPPTTPTQGPTVTPVPTPISRVQPLRFTDVTFSDISATHATVVVNMNKPSRLIVTYGTNPRSLLKSATTTQYSASQNVLIDGLTPATKYYFQIAATDLSGQKIKSDIFTVRTAEPSELLGLEENVVAISSNDNILVADTLQKGVPIVAILTRQTDYELVYKLKRKISLRSIEAIIRSKNTLGMNTFAPIKDPIIATIPMAEKEPYLYAARLKTSVTGIYEISVRIRDNSGNLKEQKIVDLKVIPPLSVYAQDTKQPISDARVDLSYYNSKKKQYQRLPQGMFGKFKNPGFTNALGELDMVLPKEKYRAAVTALGFNEKTVDFTLGEKSGEEFPKVYLQNDPFYIASFINHIKAIAIDTFEKCVSVTQSLSLSVRFFNIIAGIILLSFVILSFLLLSIRTHIHLKNLPSYFLYHLHLHTGKHKKNYLFGLVADEHDQPLTQVRIEIIDTSSNNSLAHISTNKTGRFYIRNTFKTATIKLLLTKDGFTPVESLMYTDTLEDMKIAMKQGEPLPTPRIPEVFEYVVGRFFEMSLFISLILELLFFALYGLGKTAPFFVLSLFNLLLWIIFLKEQRGRN